MGLARLLGYLFRWTTMTIAIGSATYVAHDDIEKAVRHARFYFNNAEEGFVSKEHAFDLKIIHRINGKGNLETYLKNYSDRLPVYKGRNGITIGNPSYNFSNFSTKE